MDSSGAPAKQSALFVQMHRFLGQNGERQMPDNDVCLLSRGINADAPERLGSLLDAARQRTTIPEDVA